MFGRVWRRHTKQNMRKTHTYNDDYGIMADEDALDADSEGEESTDDTDEDEEGAETDDISEEDETEDLE